MPGTIQSSSPIDPLLPSLYSKAYRLNASYLGQRYSSILYRKPLTTGMYRLLKWDTSAGPLDYPEAVKYEFGKTLDVMAFKIFLPVGAEIPCLVASNSRTRFGEFIKTAMPVADPVSALNLDGCHSFPPGTISLEQLLGHEEDCILKHPRLS